MALFTPIERGCPWQDSKGSGRGTRAWSWLIKHRSFLYARAHMQRAGLKVVLHCAVQYSFIVLGVAIQFCFRACLEKVRTMHRLYGTASNALI